MRKTCAVFPIRLRVPAKTPADAVPEGSPRCGAQLPAAAQAFLTKLLTVQLPGLIVLPKRLDINIPPAVTAVAEAAVGRDAVMRAVASAVLQVSRGAVFLG